MPIMCLVVLFVVLSCIYLFKADGEVLSELDGNLYQAGIAIQIYYILMMIRDGCITVSSCIQG